MTDQMPTPQPTDSDAGKVASNRSITLVVYILFAFGLVLPVTFLVGIILAHLKRGDAVGTIYESHLTWLIRTFWFGLLGSIIGMITVFFLIGWVGLLAVIVWIIYRLVVGFLRLNDTQPITDPTRFI